MPGGYGEKKMKAVIVEYDYYYNQALIRFDADFSGTFDKYRDKAINIDIKLFKEKRSLAANRYMWVLCSKIAEVQMITKSEVYRREVLEIGGTSDVMVVRNEAVEKFCRQWESQGLGWQTEISASNDEVSNVIVYYGSSTFTKDQMTRLIENLIFEAENLGIDTDTPDKRIWWESLEEEYKDG